MVLAMSMTASRSILFLEMPARKKEHTTETMEPAPTDEGTIHVWFEAEIRVTLLPELPEPEIGEQDDRFL